MRIKIVFIIFIYCLLISECKAQWVQIGPQGGIVHTVAVSGSHVFAGMTGVYLSADNGQNWVQSPFSNQYVFSIVVNGTNVYALTTSYGLYLTTDFGQSWTNLNIPNQFGSQLLSLGISGSILFCGMYDHGIIKSTNNGQSWVQTSLVIPEIYAFTISGSNIFAGASDNLNSSKGVYLSTDGGTSWTLTSLNNEYIASLASNGSYIYAGTTNHGVYISTNSGASWMHTLSVNQQVSSVIADGANIYAGLNGIYKSTDNGLNWSQTSFITPTSLALNNSNIFAGSNSGVYTSIDNGLSWTQTNLKCRDIYSLAAYNSNIFAGSDNLLYTSNNGLNWQTTLPTLTWNLAFNSTGLFAGTNNNLRFSSNNGQTWQLINSLGYSGRITSLAVNGLNIFVGTWIGNSQLIYYSTNNGQTWNSPNIQYNGSGVFSIIANDTTIFAGGKWGAIYKSTNNGLNWTTMSSISGYAVWALAIYGQYIFAGCYGVFVSSNSGANWTQTSLNNRDIFSLSTYGSNIFAGSDSGVYKSTNNGVNWIEINEGFGNPTVYSLLINGSYLYAGTGGSSVWRRPLAELVGVQHTGNSVPKKVSLSQNYPNPFNPTTKISFAISGSSAAQTFLSVYDDLGREVATLVNQQLKPGEYETEFDGTNLPSGVYYYKLVVGDNTNNGGFSETKKMVLIK